MALFRLFSTFPNSIKIRSNRSWLERFLDVIPGRGFSRECLNCSIVMWVLCHDLVSKLSFFNFGHNTLRTWVWRFSIAIFLVMFSRFFIPSTFASDDTKYVTCNNHYAVEIPKGEKFEGRYIRCEDFDHYYLLIETKQFSKAESLLH